MTTVYFLTKLPSGGTIGPFYSEDEVTNYARVQKITDYKVSKWVDHRR